LIYPNPFNENIKIDFPEFKDEDVIIMISDISGKIVYQNTFKQSNNIILPTNDFQSGIYFLQIKQGYLNQFSKLLKIK
jgi:hypothetical protein